MSRRPATIATVVVNGGREFRREALQARAWRIECLLQLVRYLNEHRPDIVLLLLPAGFLVCRTAREVPDLAREVDRALVAVRPRFHVIWGIDGWVRRKGDQPDRDRVGYPFFVFVRKRSGQHFVVQQVSSSKSEGAAEDLARRWGRRPILIPGTEIALLVCGEIWSDALLERAAKAGARTLVIPAHFNVNLHGRAPGFGKMSWLRRLQWFSRKHQIPVLLTEHSRSPNRHSRAWGYRVRPPLPLPSPLESLFTVKVAGGAFFDAGSHRG